MPQTISHRSVQDRLLSVAWDKQSPLTLNVDTTPGKIQTRHGRFVGGKADGVEVVQVDTGAAVVTILPSRGMSIWEIQCGPTRFGWNSPVLGPVHPSLVPIHDASGIGWLEGFDELMVRCGLESNGAPQFDEHQNVVLPLHGRIGNLPADSLSIEYDEASGRLELCGEVCESRLFFTDFRLQTRIRFHAGSPDIEILDDVTNGRSVDATMQLLYHINVGPPVLGKGSKLYAPLDELAPKDSLSAGEIDSWNEYPAPESGYTERVYFSRLRSDQNKDTTAMLQNAKGTKALAVTFNTNTLDRFVVWKNAADEADGYVMGLEPATNFPNTKDYEESQGRVVTLKPEQTASFRLKLQPLVDAEAIDQVRQRIDTLAGDESTNIHKTPRPGWSPGA